MPAAQTLAQETSIDWQHISTLNDGLPIPGEVQQQTASLILDIDRDGINDFVIGSRQGPGVSLVWYQRTANGWTRYLIESEVLDIEAGGAFHDIDGDGDLDIVMGGDYQSNQVWWWENPYPEFSIDSEWNRYLIKDSGNNIHHDQLFGDVDGDNQTELVFWNQASWNPSENSGRLLVADIPADPKNGPWPLVEIFSGFGEGLALADINGDGKEDIVGGGHWFEHRDGTDFIPHPVDSNYNFTRVAVGQLIQGGAPEVVLVSGDGVGPLNWYEFDGETWKLHRLIDSVDHGHSLQVTDVNQDGFADIFVAEMRLNGDNPDAQSLLLLGDGQGNFERTTISTGMGNHESKVADLDGDGDLDILGKPYNWETPRLDIWLNQGIQEPVSISSPWTRQVVDEQRPGRAIFITAADMNGDDLPDLITGGWWYQNPGRPSLEWVRRPIGAPLNNVATVFDFDDDGDQDVLGTAGQGAEANSQLLWAENDGEGLFTIHNNIEAGIGDFLQGVAILHLADGTRQVALSWHSGVGVQAITVPANPAQEIWRWQQLSEVSQNEDLSAGDIDRDGDLDLLLGTIWLQQNDDGWQPIIIDDTNDPPDRNRLADINGDGRLDAVVGFEAISSIGPLVWYEQGADPATNWPVHIIADPPIVGPMSLDVADIDDDGDVDIVAGEHNTERPEDASLFVFINVDGRGLSWERELIYQGDEHHDGAQFVDVDDDGDLDVASIGWTHDRVIIYENNQTNANDSPPVSSPTTIPTPTLAPDPPLAEPDQALRLPERITEGLVAYYPFEDGSGNLVTDQSQVTPSLNLVINDLNAVTWLPQGGLSIKAPVLIRSQGTADKIVQSISQSNALTVEAWIKPANTQQDGPARIITLSADTNLRNLTLGQGLWDDQPSTVYDVRLRTAN
jgi:hypothetical protein